MKIRDNLSIIRVYGDSLCMPRFFDGIYYNQTYAELIKNECGKLWSIDSIALYNRSRFDAKIEDVCLDIAKDSKNFGVPGGKMLVVQCGVCDCAPRPIPEFLRRIINKFPGKLKFFIITFLHNNRARIQKIGFWRNTNPKDFYEYYFKMLLDVSKEFSSVYVINIAPTNKKTEKHSPGFSSSIVEYNALIYKAVNKASKNNVSLIDIFSKIQNSKEHIDSYINKEDGHHITRMGHELIKDLIVNIEKLK